MSAEKTPLSQKDIKVPDPVALSKSMLDTYARAQPVLEEFVEKQIAEYGEFNFDPLNVAETYQDFVNSFWHNPEKFWALQTEYWQKSLTLWQESQKKWSGEAATPVITPDKSDRRFKADEWNENALFDFIKQSYLLTCEWAERSVQDTETLTEDQKEKLTFASKLFTSALSPTNFALTNPEVIKETINSGGDNLLRGLENLIEDLGRGSIRTTDDTAFTLGENIATTEGAVIHRNDLMELIQYKPTTQTVHKRPLLIIPPWINKYYILDLRPDNSFIKWAVEQGHTVFVISWVNPDKKLAQKRFEDYMREGVITALDQIKSITGEPDCNAIGYCLGGTLLNITLAYLAAHKQENRIKSATFFTTLTDFEHAGDMKLFMSDEQIDLMDKQMAESGVLEGKSLQQTFSLLRSNDLIWSFVVNNYLMGKEPFPFDLLYWNNDSTNMPAAMHSFYLRKLYRDNLLAKPGGITMDGTPIDLTAIKTPAYFLSTREDHIAPWRATYKGAQNLGGPKGDNITFTLAASGHIAGVVNPPAKNKYCFWSNSKTPKDPETWLSSSTETEGSWWPHWQEWITPHLGGEVKPRKILKKATLAAAPGEYVRVKS